MTKPKNKAKALPVIGERLKIGIDGLRNTLQHSSDALNLAVIVENDAIADRKAKQTAHELALSAFRLGVSEILAQSGTVKVID